jgi:lipid-A-disaccharide synthase
MNEKYSDIFFIFHSTIEHSVLIKNFLLKEKFENCEVISDEKIKSDILNKSIFAVAQSGTISLEICNAKFPSVIIYKMSKINFFIIKNLVKVKSPNIINIAADEEVIPELLQSKCNPKDIFKTVDKLLNDKNILEKQIAKSQEIINNFKKGKSSEIASAVLLNQL